METFDDAGKSSIINNKGISYLEFRNSIRPRYGLVWFDIFLFYAGLATVLGLVAFIQRSYPSWFVLNILVGSLFIGYIIQAIHLFMHEAAHFNVASDKRKNDQLANIFIGLLIGMDVGFFRAMHLAHHKYLGTVKDPEKSYFDALTWRLIFESLTGIRALKVVTHRNKNIKLNYEEDQSAEIISKNNTMFFTATFLNVLLVVVFFALGYWQVSLAWLVGFGAVFPFFASLRNILEHRTEEAIGALNYNEVDQGASHRMFGDGLIASTLGPAGFNRHLLHHWDPQVSYTRLRDVEYFLQDTQLGPKLNRNRTTYLQTFSALLNR